MKYIKFLFLPFLFLIDYVLIKTMSINYYYWLILGISILQMILIQAFFLPPVKQTLLKPGDDY